MVLPICICILILHTFVLTENQGGYPRKNLWNKRKKLGLNHSGKFSLQILFHDLLLLIGQCIEKYNQRIIFLIQGFAMEKKMNSKKWFGEEVKITQKTLT